MGLFRKKPDPINERARALQAEISALESQINQLNEKLADQPVKPRLRSTVAPSSQTTSSAPVPSLPVFEPSDVSRLKPPADTETTAAHYNELGMRKFDLTGSWRRLKDHFRTPPAANPQLVNFLAAGSIKGLRPLRYEKRVARNRFIMFFIILLGVLLILFGSIFGRH